MEGCYIAAFIQADQKLGYELCESSEFEVGCEKIAICPC